METKRKVPKPKSLFRVGESWEVLRLGPKTHPFSFFFTRASRARDHLFRYSSRRDDHNLEDRISLLPDEILILVVLLLSLNEAAITSVLSRRWRCVWAFTTRLHFDALETFFSAKLIKRERRKYVNWVNHIVISINFISDIDKWLKFELARRVNRLVLDFSLDPHSTGNCRLSYTFPADCDDYCLLGYTSFIKASPILAKFVLQVEWTSTSSIDKRKVRKAERCSHQHLEEVELAGYYGRITDLELVMYFFENAVAFKKIIVDPRDPYSLGLPKKIKEIKKENAARVRAKQQLKGRVPAGVRGMGNEGTLQMKIGM
ncbi:unnamed protein product [Ilex paraguariensis]|uniref:F-box domain-containing protein n=1 Tax=Ilex paraguariensis TaxID=185542 RepID=A0ABC8R107_9AQUA